MANSICCRIKARPLFTRAFFVCVLFLTVLQGQCRTTPRIFPSNALPKSVADNLHCYVHSLTFYKNKLYTTASIGLIEIENGEVRNIYTWDLKGGGISEGPWKDTANDLLWVRLNGGTFLNFDGKTWKSVKFPKPMEGYITRDDAWRGFRGVSNHKTFWLEGARRAWKWEPIAEKWSEEIFPRSSLSSPYLVKRIIPCNQGVYCLLRDCAETSLVLVPVAQQGDWPEATDIPFWFQNGKLNEITNYVGFLVPTKFCGNSFKDIKSLYEKLTRRTDALSTYLFSNLSEKTRKELEHTSGERVNRLRLQKYLIEDLDRLIKNEAIYNGQRFDGVVIKQETRNLMSPNPQGEDLVRLNRLLLEDAYPLEITHNHFIAEETAAGLDKGYVLTKSGDLLEMTSASITKLSTPGVCNAIVVAPSGTLLASFGALGVFELKPEWRRILNCPYSELNERFRVRLASREGEIAFALEPKEYEDSGIAAKPLLWVSEGREWVKVSFPNNQIAEIEK